MGKCLQDYFAVNPLEDPIVKSTLGDVQMSGQQLIEMSVKELNKQLAGCSSFVVSKLKKCRRTLKNRGYAKSCRIKRIVAKSELEQVNARLLAELTELRQRNRSLADQVHRLLSATTTTTMTTTTASCGVVGSPASPFEVAPTGQQHHNHMNRIYYEPPPAANGPSSSSSNQHHLLQQQQRHQQKCQLYPQQQQHPDPSVVHHNATAYQHGLGQHHSGGSSTCNSSPVSSLSSLGGVDTSACRTLEVDLDFVLDDHHPMARPAMLYNELPDSWSMSHASQQQSVLGFH